MRHGLEEIGQVRSVAERQKDLAEPLPRRRQLDLVGAPRLEEPRQPRALLLQLLLRLRVRLRRQLALLAQRRLERAALDRRVLRRQLLAGVRRAQLLDQQLRIPPDLTALP